MHTDLHGVVVDVLRSGSEAVNGRPVSVITSSARTTRRLLLGGDLGRCLGVDLTQPLVQRLRAHVVEIFLEPAARSGSVPGNSKRSSTARV